MKRSSFLSVLGSFPLSFSLADLVRDNEKGPQQEWTKAHQWGEHDFASLSCWYSWVDDAIQVKFRYSKGRERPRFPYRDGGDRDYHVFTSKLEDGKIVDYEQPDGAEAEMLFEVPLEHPLGDALYRVMQAVGGEDVDGGVKVDLLDAVREAESDAD